MKLLILFFSVLFVTGLFSQTPQNLPVNGSFILMEGQTMHKINLQDISEASNSILRIGQAKILVVRSGAMSVSGKLVERFQIEVLNGWLSFSDSPDFDMIKKLDFYNYYKVVKEGSQTRPEAETLPLKNSIIYFKPNF